MNTRKRKLVDHAGDGSLTSSLLDKKEQTKKVKTNDEKSSKLVESSVSQVSLVNDNKRLGFEFYDKSCLDLSQSLLGKILVRRFDDDTKVRTRIVEVEAYLGGNDSASHSFNDKRTDRTEAMFMPASTAYVYNIYGIYCCLNISAKEPGAAVLAGKRPFAVLQRIRSHFE